ncbi:AraC family transcriptional regulator [Desulforhopalus sp. 52FAK]
MPFAECRYSARSAGQFKPHMHKTFSVGAVDRGEVAYTVGSEDSSLKKGSLALINPEVIHACNSVGTRERSYYMLYLDVDWCHQVQRTLWDVPAFRKVSSVRLDSPGLYQRYISTMTLLMDKKSHLLEKEQQLVELMVSIFRVSCQVGQKSVEVTAGIDDLRCKLGSNLQDDITLESLAVEIGANPYTLLRQFKKVTGLTPHAYRMNCRIDRAKKYLQRGADIAETALECGFFDQSHLHRHFKAMTTITPSQYRVNFVQ